MRAAKTEIDIQIQEMILQAILSTIDPQSITLDAEEETPSTQLFSSHSKNTSLIIDPLDGTLKYLRGTDRYSINIGLIQQGIVKVALVYFPKRGKFYITEGKGNSTLIEYTPSLEIGSTHQLVPPARAANRILYVNNRVPANITDALVKIGYQVVNDNDNRVNWPEALIKCMNGEYSGCLFHTPQIRDVLLGAILANLTTGYALNWQGENLYWPSKGRIPNVLFGLGTPDNEVLNILKLVV